MAKMFIPTYEAEHEHWHKRWEQDWLLYCGESIKCAELFTKERIGYLMSQCRVGGEGK